MPFEFVTSTGNSFLNPTAASTWAPSDFSFWGVNFDPKNQASWLGLADYAYATLVNTFRTVVNPLARISPQAVGQAALNQRAALGTAGVDLSMLGNRLSQGVARKIAPSGALISRVAAPLYFAETLGGSTPSPTQAQQMISEPFTPASVTTLLENLFNTGHVVTPGSGAASQPQPAAWDRHDAARVQRTRQIYTGSQGGSGARKL